MINSKEKRLHDYYSVQHHVQKKKRTITVTLINQQLVVHLKFASPCIIIQFK